MDITKFSNQFQVRRLDQNDIETVFALCSRNSLYYHYCPPSVTRQSIIEDMKALPPDKDLADKYYLGYFSGKKLIAVMDFIASFSGRNNRFYRLLYDGCFSPEDGNRKQYH